MVGAKRREEAACASSLSWTPKPACSQQARGKPASWLTDQAPINHKLVTALLQTAVWGNVEHYSHRTTQRVQGLYPIALRKHRVAHY